MKLDCRDKLILEDGSACVFMNLGAKGDNLGLCSFDLFDASGALTVKSRIKGTFFRRLVFSDALGRELSTIRCKWSLPILCLPGGEEIELNFFRHQGTDFLPEASVELFGTTLCCADGVFSFSEDIEADKQGLLKAILCFCKQYPKAREKELERVERDFLHQGAVLVVLLLCYVLFKM